MPIHPTDVVALPTLTANVKAPWPTFEISDTERAAISIGALKRIHLGTYARSVAPGVTVPPAPRVHASPPAAGPHVAAPAPPAGARVKRRYPPTTAGSTPTVGVASAGSTSPPRVIRTHSPSTS